MHLSHQGAVLDGDGHRHAAGGVAIVACVFRQHTGIDRVCGRGLWRQLIECRLDERQKCLTLHVVRERERVLQGLAGDFAGDCRFDNGLVVGLNAHRQQAVPISAVLQQVDRDVRIAIGDGHLRGACAIKRVLGVDVGAT